MAHAVSRVTLDIRRGETLSLVGESGSGKTTLARCLARLCDVTSGRVVFDGKDITHFDFDELRPIRKRIQFIFQDPFGSLNPRHRIGSIIGEPLVVHGEADGAELREMVERLMETVGLEPSHYDRYPAEFSGGQRQRISIARAIALRPDLVICDEPVSALDVSVRAQILNLLQDLQKQLGLTYLFISHDLPVVRHVSDRVAVMYLGKIVELAPVEALFEQPQHPYTQVLLDSAPVPDPDAQPQIILDGDPPSLIEPPTGCSFHTRCPKAEVKCSTDVPELLYDGNRRTACHFPLG